MRRRLLAKLLCSVGMLAVSVAAFDVHATQAHAATTQPGEFVSVCAVSHRLADDPIVLPGTPGASHSHDFYGNPTTNASSTYASLTNTATRCSQPGDTAAYWVPTLLQGGVAVEAKVARIYYRGGVSDASTIRPFPAGLRMIAGNSKATAPQDLWVSSWACSVDGDEIEVPDVPTCPTGSPLR